jgi:hypothetical protein
MNSPAYFEIQADDPDLGYGFLYRRFQMEIYETDRPADRLLAD